MRTFASNLVEPSGAVKQTSAATLAEMTSLQTCTPRFVSASRLLDDLHSAMLQRELDAADDALTRARSRFAPFTYRAKADTIR